MTSPPTGPALPPEPSGTTAGSELGSPPAEPFTAAELDEVAGALWTLSQTLTDRPRRQLLASIAARLQATAAAHKSTETKETPHGE